MVSAGEIDYFKASELHMFGASSCTGAPRYNVFMRCPVLTMKAVQIFRDNINWSIRFLMHLTPQLLVMPDQWLAL